MTSTEEQGSMELLQHVQLPLKVREETKVPKHVVMSRSGFGSAGRRIPLLTNHFSVDFNSPNSVFFQYNASITSDDDKAVGGKGTGRKVMDKLYQHYGSELYGKHFTYHGEKSLFTVGPMEQNNLEFVAVLEAALAKSTGVNGSPSEGGHKRSKCMHSTNTFKVQISFAAEVPLKPIALALEGVVSENTQDSLRVLDIILRQIAAWRGCLLFRQSFFLDDSKNFTPLGGVSGCRWFHSSFRTTRDGLALNMDVSTTLILNPGPVLDFLLSNQNVKEFQQIDWGKVKKMLKNMRVKSKHTGAEFKIIGLSEKPCNIQLFTFKMRNGDGNTNGQTVEITVYDYYKNFRNIELTYSTYMPCLDVGRPKRPIYLPLELSSLVSLQRYTKALSAKQRSSLVESSRQKPSERIRVVSDALRCNTYDEDPMLSACGISISKQLSPVDGRVLSPPTLKVGNNEDFIPRDGKWNFHNKKVFSPMRIELWAIVNFSARCDTSHLSRELISCGRSKGIEIERPFTLIDEEHQWRRAGPIIRVERMFEQVKARLPKAPDFLLCVLPERKNSDIYGPWKKKNLHEMGIVTQCIAPVKINDQYLTNILLKINSKLGGINSLLAVEVSRNIPLINTAPTLILGMDVSHGSPGQSDIPSVAAVVGSRSWPLISRYRASVRTQSPKVEMIDSLYKVLPNGEDDGIIRELLLDFYQTSKQMKPSQIIVFRDGVSESQFSQVLNFELEQIIKSFRHLDESEQLPKFTVVVARKNHHTKLFQAGTPENVPPGTVVDTNVVHPCNYDFFMCPHAGKLGTSRPIHYNVLLDEIGFSPDDLQKLVHSLSYVYQRSTSAVSIVAPICYAHLAAQQVLQFVKFEDLSDSSSERVSSSGTILVPELPRLHPNVRSSMFFC